MLAAVPPGGGRLSAHQVLGPAADLRHPPAAIDVVVEVRRVSPDVDMD